MSRRVDMEERYGLSRDECESTGRVCRTCGGELLACEDGICEPCMQEVEGLVAGDVIEVVPEIVRRRTLEVAA